MHHLTRHALFCSSNCTADCGSWALAAQQREQATLHTTFRTVVKAMQRQWSMAWSFLELSGQYVFEEI
jgi:hypothetical protein